LNERPVR